LASLDPSPNILYLARPCQFTRNDSQCRTAYWTDRRYAPEVIASIDEAIDTALRGQHGGLHLVGYSGGGAVAALIAARRGDVLSLRTVAGNLDHVRLNRHHGVSAMPESLNPIDFAPRLAGLPQTHFTSETDQTVPPAIAEAFVAALGSPRCASVVRVLDTTHAQGWQDHWPGNARRLPQCR
jgi:pimeloyl-ACP methyl ester carboxylesterase